MDRSRSNNFIFLDLGSSVPPNMRFLTLRRDSIIENSTCPSGRATIVEEFRPSTFSDTETTTAKSELATNGLTLPITPSTDDTPLPTHSPSTQRSEDSEEEDTCDKESSLKRAQSLPPDLSTVTEDKLALKDVDEVYILAHPRFLPIQGMDTTLKIPDVVVCKDSWALSSSEQCDGAIFSGLRGQFGIPDVWGYTILEDNQPFTIDLKGEELDMDIGEGLDMDMVKDTSREVKSMEVNRTHTRTFYRTVGEELSTCGSPRELVTVLLHAAIGQ